jgi:hypothetical protein
MIKHFCDECETELSAEELRFSLDMTGKELCDEHVKEYIESCKREYILRVNNRTYANDLTFIYPID